MASELRPIQPQPLPPLQQLRHARRESHDSILAKNLLVARLAAGLTQQQLAGAADVSRATIAQIEAGLSDPRLSTIVQLSNAIGISPVLLLSGELEVSALAGLAQKTNKSPDDLAVSPQDQRRMAQLAGTGMLRDRVRAAKFGAAIAQASGSSPSAIVGAAIGSAIQPGDGTVSSALFAELSKGNRDEPPQPESPPDR